MVDKLNCYGKSVSGMIRKLFADELYIRIRENRIEAKNLSSGSGWESIVSERPFTTERLLVGIFGEAQSILIQLVKRITTGGILRRSPHVVIHPMDKVQGGLSEVEERIFRELALGAGAYRVVVYIGSELTDGQASQILRDE